MILSWRQRNCDMTQQGVGSQEFGIYWRVMDQGEVF
jgi:hypothetical protein